MGKPTKRKKRVNKKKKISKNLKSRIVIKKKDVYEDDGLDINVDSLMKRDPSNIRSNGIKFRVKVKRKK